MRRLGLPQRGESLVSSSCKPVQRWKKELSERKKCLMVSICLTSVSRESLTDLIAHYSAKSLLCLYVYRP